MLIQAASNDEQNQMFICKPGVVALQYHHQQKQPQDTPTNFARQANFL